MSWGDATARWHAENPILSDHPPFGQPCPIPVGPLRCDPIWLPHTEAVPARRQAMIIDISTDCLTGTGHECCVIRVGDAIIIRLGQKNRWIA